MGDPAFCRIEPDLRIETPYFSIDPDPALLVGVDSEGRRLRMQGSVRQEQSQLEIRVTSSSELEAEQNRWRGCQDYQLNGAEGLLCDRSGNSQVWREYLLRRGDVAVVVEISASQLGISSLSGLEQALESLEVHETERRAQFR